MRARRQTASSHAYTRLTSRGATGLKAKSDALREQRKRERLEAYTLKNFGDYFDFVEGSQRGELTENDKAIRAWLAKRDAAAQH